MDRREILTISGYFNIRSGKGGDSGIFSNGTDSEHEDLLGFTVRLVPKPQISLRLLPTLHSYRELYRNGAANMDQKIPFNLQNWKTYSFSGDPGQEGHRKDSLLLWLVQGTGRVEALS